MHTPNKDPDNTICSQCYKKWPCESVRDAFEIPSYWTRKQAKEYFTNVVLAALDAIKEEK